MKKSLLFATLCLCVFFCTCRTVYAVRLGAFEIHPFVDVTEQYTDNVFNTRTDRQSDFATIITPGIQLIFPRTERRYRLEILYQTIIEQFDRYSSENAVGHKATGKFQYKMPTGIDLSVSDEFTRSHDLRGTNLDSELDFYLDNVVAASVAYNLSDRVRLQADYSHYFIHYDADRNNFRDRHDNTYAGYVYYRFMPKTSAFLEYEYVFIDYDESSALNSGEQHFFAGVTWDVTHKTKGTVKGGFETKDFEDSSIGGYRGYIVEVDIDHNFSSRDSVKIVGVRRTNETNIMGSDFFVTTGLLVEYYHRLTGKITGKGYVSYGTDDYHGSFARKDDTWRGGVSLSYQMKKWLRIEAGYSYTIRNSTVDDFDYKNNTYYMRVGATL